jgi:hypothetical protein
MQYGIYRSTDEVGKVAIHVGYGRSGTGLTGDTIASGTERFGLNRYDTTAQSLGFGSNRTAQLIYDFDDGTAAHDALGWYLGASMANVGLGDNEVMAAAGDSGGPAFIDGLVAGVTSYGMRLIKFVGGRFTSSDIDRVINSSFGELGGDARVSYYAGWIDSIIGSGTVTIQPHAPGSSRRNRRFEETDVAEPTLGGLFMLGGLAAFATRRRKSA